MVTRKKVNKDFFKVWDCKMAYVLGFFAADGCITVHANGGEYIDFHVSDGELLYKIRDVMESTHHVKERRWRDSESVLFRMQIGSKEMCNDLRGLGFSERKTHHMPLPAVPEEFLGPFVRGYFDGDGHESNTDRIHQLLSRVST